MILPSGFSIVHSLSRAPALRGRPTPTRPLLAVKTMRPRVVVPSVALVLAHHRELHAVDGQQLFERQAERLGGEDVDFDQCLAASVVAAQCAVSLPLRRESAKNSEGRRRSWLAQTFLREIRLPARGPEGGVM